MWIINTRQPVSLAFPQTPTFLSVLSRTGSNLGQWNMLIRELTLTYYRWNYILWRSMHKYTQRFAVGTSTCTCQFFTYQTNNIPNISSLNLNLHTNCIKSWFDNIFNLLSPHYIFEDISKHLALLSIAKPVNTNTL